MNRELVPAMHARFVEALEGKAYWIRTLEVHNAESIDAKNALAREEAVLQAAAARLDLIIDPKKEMDPAEAARIADLISEFDFIQNFAFGTLYHFSVLPSDFLIIVLVMAMGILGSTMQMTYDHYRAGGVQKTSLFFLRPMLGAITALVLFILLKAGVLVVTDSAQLGQVAPLNPFFIAFVGIVSGLLSENALETVRGVGSSWLRSSAPDAEARWAVGIGAQLSETKTLDDLAAKTGIDLAELKQWVEQKKPTPAAIQKVLAAWLNQDRQSLFTDLPPRSTP